MYIGKKKRRENSCIVCSTQTHLYLYALIYKDTQNSEYYFSKYVLPTSKVGETQSSYLKQFV